MDFPDWLVWGKFNWWSTANNYTAGRTNKRKIEYLHRKIMNPPIGTDVDHINGNKHDNRRLNLRLATRTQNNGNQKPHKKKRSSKYKGVSWQRSTSKWYAYINRDKVRRNLGYYENEDDAARAYNKAATSLFGEYALLNEISD